jgi:hypothetical protein
VSINVEVAARGTMVECPVSLDGYEPIFEMSSETENSSGEPQLGLEI